MSIIQLILTVSILLLLWLYIRHFKSQLISKILFSLLFVAGIVAVIFPDITNKIANFVGVGRGADLLLYITVIVFYTSLTFIYSRFKKIENRQTEILRLLTIDGAKKLPKNLSKKI